MVAYSKGYKPEGFLPKGRIYFAPVVEVDVPIGLSKNLENSTAPHFYSFPVKTYCNYIGRGTECSCVPGLCRDHKKCGKNHLIGGFCIPCYGYTTGFNTMQDHLRKGLLFNLNMITSSEELKKYFLHVTTTVKVPFSMTDPTHLASHLSNLTEKVTVLNELDNAAKSAKAKYKEFVDRLETDPDDLLETYESCKNRLQKIQEAIKFQEDMKKQKASLVEMEEKLKQQQEALDQSKKEFELANKQYNDKYSTN